MTQIPSPETIIHLLHRLDEAPADHLESEILDFKRWEGAKNSLSEAVQMAICFANAEGGVVVFGVKDGVKGRGKAITGCDRYDLDVWRRGIYESIRPHLTVEISELEVPEGKLILVRVPKGSCTTLWYCSRVVSDPGQQELHAIFPRGFPKKTNQHRGLGLERRGG
jgi:ATP-dependent DNA helicase RecG